MRQRQSSIAADVVRAVEARGWRRNRNGKWCKGRRRYELRQMLTMEGYLPCPTATTKTKPGPVGPRAKRLPRTMRTNSDPRRSLADLCRRKKNKQRKIFTSEDAKRVRRRRWRERNRQSAGI